MSAWKKPSRRVWRRNDWISVSARCVEIVAGGPSAATSDILMPSIHSMVTHVAAGALPVDRGHAEARIVLGVLGHLRQGGGLEPQIHLDLGRLLERLGDLHRPQAAGGRHVALLQARDQIEGLEIAVEALAHAGADDLDGDLAGQRRSRRRPRPDGPGRSRRRRSAARSATKRSSTGPAERSLDRALARRFGKVAIRSCSPGEIERRSRRRRRRAGWRGTGRA